MISIVSPVYNSKDTLNLLVKQINFYVKQITKKFELILVDDFSSDTSWDKIKKLKKKYKFIKGLKLNKNYGQHTAISIGITHSKNNIVIVMDCDLEDNPKHIIDMVKLHNKYRKPVIIYNIHKLNFKRLLSKIFWFFLKIISLKNFNHHLGNYILIDKKVKKRYLSLRNKTYYYGDLIYLKTKFQILKKKREETKRKEGSAYNFCKLISMSLSLIMRYNFFSEKFKFMKRTKPKKITIDNII
jgi:dolichol-phosphate mannosyltransferase